MTPAEVEAYCLSRPAATVDRPFGPALRTFKVGGKIFALLDDGGGLCFKASEIAFEVLREQGRAHRAPYLPRGGWLKVPGVAQWDASELCGLIDTSHALVARGLTRKMRQALGIV